MAFDAEQYFNVEIVNHETAILLIETLQVDTYSAWNSEQMYRKFFTSSSANLCWKIICIPLSQSLN